MSLAPVRASVFSSEVGLSLVAGAALSPVVLGRDREIYGGRRLVPFDLDLRLAE